MAFHSSCVRGRRAHTALFLVLMLSVTLVSALSVSSDCDAPLPVPKGDGETIATLGRVPPCVSIDAPLMRRVLLPGIRLEVDSRFTSNNNITGLPVPPVRVRVSSNRENFLSLTLSPEQTLAKAFHPFVLGDGVLDTTIEFIADLNVATELLRSLEYVNADLRVPDEQGIGEDANETSQREVNNMTRETQKSKNKKVKVDALTDVVYVDVFGDATGDTMTAQPTRLTIDIMLLSGSPFEDTNSKPSDKSFLGKKKGTLRTAPVLVALLVFACFLFAVVRAIARVCLPILYPTSDPDKEKKRFQQDLLKRIAKRNAQNAERMKRVSVFRDAAPNRA